MILSQRTCTGKLARFDYDVDTTGQRIRAVETNENGQTTIIDWIYDEIGRLWEELYDSHNDLLDYKAEYHLDLVGNRREMWVDKDQDDHKERRTYYTFDANDRILTEQLRLNWDGESVLNSTAYEYGPSNLSTQQTRKTVHNGQFGSAISLTDYVHDLQGRLDQVKFDDGGNGIYEQTTDYAYNADGHRVSQAVTVIIDNVPTTTTTSWLVDGNNHTGYSQVLEERVAGSITKSYILGHDVIAQAGATATAAVYLLYDGHGSTRKLTDLSGDLVANQTYAFDAYGNAIGFNPATAVTTLLYSGEQTCHRSLRIDPFLIAEN